MIRFQRNVVALAVCAILLSSACSPGGSVEPTSGIEPTQARATQMEIAPTLTSPPPTRSATPTEIPPTPTPTSSPTSTIAPLMIAVSENTNCRTGPGLTYDVLGVLLVEEKAEVVAQSTVSDYWYISLPSNPEINCWLSGVYATLVGDPGLLPILTPMPSPTPSVGFDLFLTGFETGCDLTMVVFAIQNTGGQVLMSGYVDVADYETGKQLYGPAKERFPFAPQVRPICPPGHGNYLPPGAVEYIHAPIDPVPHGHRARGIVTLCTGDHQAGDCVTKTIYFFIE